MMLRWKKLLVWMIKINLDAVVDKNKDKMGMRIIARNHEGKALASMCGTEPNFMTCLLLRLWRLERLWNSVETRGSKIP